MNFCIKSRITSATNEILELRGTIVLNCLCMRNLIITYFIYFFAGINRINTCEESKNWMLLPEAVKNLAVLWHVLHGHWDNKDNILGAVTHFKYFFAINYQEFKEEGCAKDLNLHHSHQRRKGISNSMSNKCGLTLTKSTAKHEALGKS